MPGKNLFFAAFLFIALIACQKEVSENTNQNPLPTQTINGWIEHFIAKGKHASDKNQLKSLSLTEMKFLVRFDSSAIYQCIDTNNQRDINKLYGFADNNSHHHTNSARIGWRWYQNQLQLFAYIYNNSIESDRFITAVPLKQEITCSIRAEGSTYTFKVNGTTVTMPRASTTQQAVGYQLYPYFGGDEVAPQDIRVWVKDIQ